MTSSWGLVWSPLRILTNLKNIKPARLPALKHTMKHYVYLLGPIMDTCLFVHTNIHRMSATFKKAPSIVTCTDVNNIEGTWLE